jgi:hypothetical protein
MPRVQGSNWNDILGHYRLHVEGEPDRQDPQVGRPPCQRLALILGGMS